MSVTNTPAVSLRMKRRKLNRTFLADERQTPGKRVHEVREPVRMGGAIELPDVQDITLVLENSRFVVVTIEIVRAREESHDRWETCCPRLSVHPIAKITARVSTREKCRQPWSQHTQHPELHVP